MINAQYSFIAEVFYKCLSLYFQKACATEVIIPVSEVFLNNTLEVVNKAAAAARRNAHIRKKVVAALDARLNHTLKNIF